MPGPDSRGGTASPYADGPYAFNRSDLMFTMMMIPHHQQAIEMSDILLAKSGVDQRVSDLAQQIADAQTQEIEMMEAWLDDWGMPPMDGMRHGNGLMGNGTTSDDVLARLEAADARDATRLFLEQMIVHHEDAIEMAEDELASGSSREVRALSKRIIEDQSAEIATMESLLTEV